MLLSDRNQALRSKVNWELLIRPLILGLIRALEINLGLTVIEELPSIKAMIYLIKRTPIIQSQILTSMLSMKMTISISTLRKKGWSSFFKILRTQICSRLTCCKRMSNNLKNSKKSRRSALRKESKILLLSIWVFKTSRSLWQSLKRDMTLIMIVLLVAILAAKISKMKKLL